MAAFTVVSGDLAEAVVTGSRGRRLGPPVRIDHERPHWQSPAAYALSLEEHAYVIWKGLLIAIDTLDAWMEFQDHFEKSLVRSPQHNRYQLVAVTRNEHKQLFYPYPDAIRRTEVSYWATPTHDMNPSAQMRAVSPKWVKKLMRQRKNVYVATSPSRSIRQRLNSEHIYGVMEWNGYRLITCVDTDMLWYLFRQWRTLKTTIQATPGLNTVDTIPTKFIVVSEKIHQKIKASSVELEWTYRRQT